MMVGVLIGAIPVWSYSRDWGFAPAGIVGTELLVLFALLATGRI